MPKALHKPCMERSLNTVAASRAVRADHGHYQVVQQSGIVTLSMHGVRVASLTCTSCKPQNSRTLTYPHIMAYFEIMIAICMICSVMYGISIRKRTEPSQKETSTYGRARGGFETQVYVKGIRPDVHG